MLISSVNTMSSCQSLVLLSGPVTDPASHDAAQPFKVLVSVSLAVFDHPRPRRSQLGKLLLLPGNGALHLFDVNVHLVDDAGRDADRIGGAVVVRFGDAVGHGSCTPR